MPEVTSFQLHGSWESPSTTSPSRTSSCPFLVPLHCLVFCLNKVSVKTLMISHCSSSPMVQGFFTSPIALSWGNSVPCPQQSSCRQGQLCLSSQERHQYSLQPRTWQPHPSPGASTMCQGCSPQLALGTKPGGASPSLLGSPCCLRQSFGAPFASLLHSPLLSVGCAPADQLRRVFLQQERSPVLPQPLSAGISVGPPPSPVCCVAFLGWPYSDLELL